MLLTSLEPGTFRTLTRMKILKVYQVCHREINKRRPRKVAAYFLPCLVFLFSYRSPWSCSLSGRTTCNTSTLTRLKGSASSRNCDCMVCQTSQFFFFSKKKKRNKKKGKCASRIHSAFLFCSDNNISALPEGVFDGLSTLLELRLEINKLTSLPLSFVPKFWKIRRNHRLMPPLYVYSSFLLLSLALSLSLSLSLCSFAQSVLAADAAAAPAPGLEPADVHSPRPVQESGCPERALPLQQPHFPHRTGDARRRKKTRTKKEKMKQDRAV